MENTLRIEPSSVIKGRLAIMHHQCLIKARAVISNGYRLLIGWEKHKQLSFLSRGTLEPGESIEACLVRELQKELSLDVAGGPLLGCLEWHWQEGEQAY